MVALPNHWSRAVIATILEWFLNLLFVRHDIGRHGDVYLQRWEIWGTRLKCRWGFRIFVHRFLRSDYEHALHDHPWPFWSLILWPGYYEHSKRVVRWYGPFSFLRRGAKWAHRIEIKDPCWTLFCTGEKVRSWGFHCPKGWIHWTKFESNGNSCEAQGTGGSDGAKQQINTSEIS